MTDIAGQLRDLVIPWMRCYAVPSDCVQVVNDAAEALTAPPPEEIAGYVKMLENASDAHVARGNPVTSERYLKAATALHSLALENERLRKLVECKDCMECDRLPEGDGG